MALDVDVIRKTVDKIYRKNQVGGYIDTETYNNLAKKIQLSWYNKRLSQFESTIAINKDLQDLKVTKFIPTTTGAQGVNIPLPSDYWGYISMSVPTGFSKDGNQESTRVQAEWVTDAEFDSAYGSEAFKPTDMFPIIKPISGNIEMLPTTISGVYLSYIKYPDPPIWNYVITNGREVYNSSTSTQFTIPDNGFDEVVDMFLVELGVSTRDQFVAQYGAQAQDADGK